MKSQTPKTVVSEGSFAGLVLDVSAGVVTQKVNRQGDSVQHAASALSRSVFEGEIVDIKYVNGIGIVGGKGRNEVGMTIDREMER